MLAFAIDGKSTSEGNKLSEVSSSIELFPLDEHTLLHLAHQFPDGLIWSPWSAGGTFTPGISSEQFPQLQPGKKQKPTSGHHERNNHLLYKAFPNIGRLLYTPVIDMSQGNITAGCFAFTFDRSRSFSVEQELNFMKTMMNSVSAEVSRLHTRAVSTSKSDFLSVVSHELRSPLHGILAAAELLEETSLDTYQLSLIGTQISCGRTLLQVIEHVLDYSKINSFEKNPQAAGTQDGTSAESSGSLTSRMQNLYEQVDVAELVEEVVEGSIAGRNHSTSHAGPKLFDEKSRKNSDIAGPKAIGFTKDVAVILDLAYQQDWTFVTQPGAVRRILMNVLGNALKYTSVGCIRISLGMTGSGKAGPSHDEVTNVLLTISDTGKGMSREFLRKRLFTPFSQEDYISSGCGLGLSIVRSLVDGLHGGLEVRSEKEVGTTVVISLPLDRKDGEQARGVARRPRSHSVVSGLSLGYVGFVVPEEAEQPADERYETKIKQTIQAAVSTTMVDWLGMKPLKVLTPIVMLRDISVKYKDYFYFWKKLDALEPGA